MSWVGEPNREPSVEQLLVLVARAQRKVLRPAEIVTLQLGIRGLADGAVLGYATDAGRLLLAAARLYASAYGLSVDQAEAEIRAEAGL